MLRFSFGRFAAGLVFSFAATAALHAWDYAGHRMVNQVALAALPDDFPAFVREAATAERIAFLAGEPDRWRNISDLPLKHFNGLDHYFDAEEPPQAGIALEALPSLRYQFVAAFAAGRAEHAANFPAIDPTKNADHAREWPGFAPWAVTEYYGKLKSEFAYLKAFEEGGGTAEEIANAKANIVYVMGVMGHYVGDLAQPLHTTVNHNGWVQDNPKGYTTQPGIHSWIDGGFIEKAGITPAEVLARVEQAAPLTVAAREDARDPLFVAVIDYIRAQHTKLEPLYALDKEGKFRLDGTGDPTEGRQFIVGQLRTGGHMLASIWLTAWRNAPPDTYLRAQLLKRQAAAHP
jgi:hypothetical protein